MTIQLVFKGKPMALPGFNHKITWTDGIKSSDASGSSSSSEENYHGFKPVMVSVSFRIKQGDSTSFKQLYDLFHTTIIKKESKEEKEAREKREKKTGKKEEIKPRREPAVFNLTHSELNAWGVNQVKFSGDLRCALNSTLEVYDIGVTLKQFRSTEEKKDEKEEQEEEVNTTTKTRKEEEEKTHVEKSVKSMESYSRAMQDMFWKG